VALGLADRLKAELHTKLWDFEALKAKAGRGVGDGRKFERFLGLQRVRA